MSRIAAANRERYVEARRDHILAAALRAFSDYGFAETTMERVAERAGVAKGSLYIYFQSKQALLEELTRRYSLLPDLPDLIESLYECPPALGIPTLVAELWKRLTERKELARVLVREIQSHPERGRLFTEQVGLRANRLLAGYLDKWIERGELRRMDAMAAAHAMFGMLWYFLLTQELMGGRELHPMSDSQIETMVARIFLEGAINRDPPT